MTIARLTLVISLGVTLGLLPGYHEQIAFANDGYFKKQKTETLEISQPGSRSADERMALLSIFGGALLVGAIGTYYALDSRSLSDQVSATRTHSDLVWSQERATIYDDAERSVSIAQVSFGISGALFLAGIVTYIVTEPDRTTSYAEIQSRLDVLPTFNISSGGAVFAQKSWSY